MENMNLNAATTYAAVLLKSGLEHAASKEHAWHSQRIELISISIRVDVGRANQFEGSCCSSSFGNLRAFKVHRALKYSCRVERWHVGRRQHPRCIRVVVPVLSFPATHWDHFQVAAKLKVLIEHSSEFGDGHTVTSR